MKTHCEQGLSLEALSLDTYSLITLGGKWFCLHLAGDKTALEGLKNFSKAVGRRGTAGIWLQT